jgi:hypothetical protein
MAYQYKHLSVSDLPLLKALLAVFGEAFGEPDTYQGAVPSDAYLKALLGKPHFIAVVGLRGVCDAVLTRLRFPLPRTHIDSYRGLPGRFRDSRLTAVS